MGISDTGESVSAGDGEGIGRNHGAGRQGGANNTGMGQYDKWGGRQWGKMAGTGGGIGVGAGNVSCGMEMGTGVKKCF